MYCFSFIKWNFTKFLVNKEGKPVKRYAPNTEPFVSVPVYLLIAANHDVQCSLFYSYMAKIGEILKFSFAGRRWDILIGRHKELPLQSLFSLINTHVRCSSSQVISKTQILV